MTHMIKVVQAALAAAVALLTVEATEAEAPAMVVEVVMVAVDTELIAVDVTVSTMLTCLVKISPPTSRNLKRIFILNILLLPPALTPKSLLTVKNGISTPKGKEFLNQ